MKTCSASTPFCITPVPLKVDRRQLWNKKQQRLRPSFIQRTSRPDETDSFAELLMSDYNLDVRTELTQRNTNIELPRRYTCGYLLFSLFSLLGIVRETGQNDKWTAKKAKNTRTKSYYFCVSLCSYGKINCRKGDKETTKKKSWYCFCLL